MADVRTFRARSMREALDLVRDELGADALILHTRQVARRRLLPWKKAVQEVEITASRTFDTSPKQSRKPARRSAQARTEPATPTSAETSRATTAARPAAPLPSMPHKSQPSGPRLDVSSEPPASVADVLGRPRSLTAFHADSPSTAESEAPRFARRRFFEKPPERHAGTAAADTIAPKTLKADPADPTAALSRRLDAIQQMLQDLGRSQVRARHEEIPSELFQLYTELIDGEVEDALARELIWQLKRSATPGQLTDLAAAKALLTARVESEIRCCEPITPRPGRRKVVALVGATGVGKTTTIAKLAANFRLRSGIKMGLVTVDTYRVAAVEQLRTYAEIIELPMKVVTNPLEMRRALDELAGLDLVLVDTGGRSPKDDLQIQELKSLLAEARVDEVHLVLSLTSSVRMLEVSAAKFAPAGTTSMILTKLDEASGVGVLLSVARRINLPISYLTAGQAVPDDIEPAHPRRIARLILGQERAAK